MTKAGFLLAESEMIRAALRRHAVIEETKGPGWLLVDADPGPEMSEDCYFEGTGRASHEAFSRSRSTPR